MPVPTAGLEGCWAKIARANQQLDALEADLAAAPDYADAVTFRQEFDPDASTIEITIESVPKLLLELGLAAADPVRTSARQSTSLHGNSLD